MGARFPDPKDPGDATPWSFDHSDEMTSLGDTISTSAWVVPAGLTEDSNSATTTVATVKLSGGTVNTDYDVVNTIVTTAGYTFERTATVRVKDIDT